MRKKKKKETKGEVIQGGIDEIFICLDMFFFFFISSMNFYCGIEIYAHLKTKW